MNAKQELIEHIGDRKVDCVEVIQEVWDGPSVIMRGTLAQVLPLLDFSYDDGYGIQELFGTIWYEDGTWSERREYDGSEWWEHMVRPEMPK